MFNDVSSSVIPEKKKVNATAVITNTGNTNMVTVMWANEAFDPEHPDTYFVEV